MKRTRIILLMLLLSAVVRGMDLDADMGIDSLVRCGKLPNGLTYILRSNKIPLERANFYLVQNVGAVQEEDSQDGLAHFLEHMAFNGTKHYPGKEMIDYLERVGVKFGENINAYTSYDETVYHLDDVPTVRVGIVDSCLLILHDWSGYISLDGEEIEKERGVIREEWRTRDNAGRRMYFKHISNTLPGTRYAVRNIIGDTAVVNNFAHEELRSYYHKWYRPDLQCVIIVGDIDVDEVEAKIKRLWRDIKLPKASKLSERVWEEISMSDSVIASVVKDKECQRTVISVDFRRPAVEFDRRGTYRNYIDGLNMAILCRGINLRFRELIEDPESPFVNISCSDEIEVPRMESLSFGVLAKPDSSVESARALFREVERLYRYGLSASEVSVVIKMTERDFRDSYSERYKRDNEEYTEEYIRHFTEWEGIPGIEKEWGVVREHLKGLDVDSINSYLRKYIHKNVVLYMSSGESDESINSDEELIKIYEEVCREEIEPYDSEEVLGELVGDIDDEGVIISREKGYLDSDVIMLSNGIKVIMKQTDNTEGIITMKAISYGGRSVLEGDEVLASRIVGEVAKRSGIGDYSESELRQILAGKSVGLSVNVGSYSDEIDGRCMVEDIETMCQMYYLAMNPMRRDSSAYRLVIESLKSSLRERESNPNSAFTDTLRKIMGNGNDYLERISKENIEMIGFEDILNVYDNRFNDSKKFVLLVVGNYEKDSLEMVISKYIGSLKGSHDDENYVEREMYLPEGIIEKRFEREMETRKASCALVFSGRMEYSRECAIAFSMLKELLRMRYTETIREEEGGTYGVRCSTVFNGIVEDDYSLMLNFETDPEQIDRLEPLLRKEIETIADGGLRLEDLEKVRKNMLKARAEQLHDDDVWMYFLVSKEMWNKDLYTDFDKQVNSITAEDVKEMAQKILTDNNVIEVIMLPKD